MMLPASLPQQSPLDLCAPFVPVPANFEPLKVGYNRTAVGEIKAGKHDKVGNRSVIQKAVSVSFSANAKQDVSLGADSFYLTELHFHALSEH